jgi:hypothetical protein
MANVKNANVVMRSAAASVITSAASVNLGIDVCCVGGF